MADYRNNRRRYEQHWPHFDNRGPEYYFQEDRPRPPRRPMYDDETYYGNGYQGRDFFEDEFYPQDETNYRPYDERRDRWPDDEFYYNRPQRREENFIGRGLHRLNDMWRELRGEGPYYNHYPEDRHQHYYGSDNHSYNGNRGARPRPRFNRY